MTGVPWGSSSSLLLLVLTAHLFSSIYCSSLIRITKLVMNPLANGSCDHSPRSLFSAIGTVEEADKNGALFRGIKRNGVFGRLFSFCQTENLLLIAVSLTVDSDRNE